MAWNIAGLSRRTRDAAVEAARRSGMGLDDWLDEAIADYAGAESRARLDPGEADDDRLDPVLERLERIARRNGAAREPRTSGIPASLDSMIERFETRLVRAETQAARAFESVARILERDNAARDSDRRALVDAVRRLESIRANLAHAAPSGETRADASPQPPGLDPKPPFDLKTAVSQIAMRRHELEARVSPSPSTQGESAPGERLAAPIGATALDLGAMRAEIDAMRRSLADLAPRNAVVALEGAIRDLIHRVETLRQSGHGESMLAPLEAIATEFRAAVKAHDSQAAAAGLEREIRAIGAKVDGLAATAIKPETFERIRQQTEEVRNLLASAALRTAPLERLERQIGELADRVERLGASPVPHLESAEMAARLAEACQQIERSTSPAALASIERRLEEIAAKLDQEIARPSDPAPIDPAPFEDLARRIDSVRQSLETLSPATLDSGPVEKLLREFEARLDTAAGADAHAQALQSIFVEIRDKLDRLADGEASVRELTPVLNKLGARIEAVASPVDLNPIETALRSLEAKFEASAAAPVDREVVEHVADEVARRLRDMGRGETNLAAVAMQIGAIYDRIDALAAKSTAADPGPAVRELLEKLRQADKAEGASALETSVAVHAALDTHLSELRAEQASADKRTQSRLADLQSVLETLTARLAGIESELAVDDVDDELRPPVRSLGPGAPAGATLPGVEALGAEAAPQRGAELRAARAEDPSEATGGEDFLIEPGAGAPQTARDLAQTIGSKTNPAVSVHIAAARRAAQAALMENNAAANAGIVKTLAGPGSAQFAARGVQTARAFYANHRRTVLLGVAVAIAATLAVRLSGVRTPFLHSELGEQAVNTAKLDTPKGKPTNGAGPAKPGQAIDVAPTASISEPPMKPRAPDLAPGKGPSADELIAAIPPGIPQALRAAVSAGQANAQYELAMRLIEGRGVPKDQVAAARWLERAASRGLAPAQYRLGSMYEKGIGVKRDPAAAKRWYLEAAEAGNARAAYNLAAMDVDPGAGEPNHAEAAKWFQKAAVLGVRDSQYNLGILYARGLGVDKDLRQSFLWFALAAQEGDADAAKKRDEIAGQMDPALLASAVEALMKFKPMKPDPAANGVAAPPGGWDKADAAPADPSSPSADAARP